MSEETNQPLFEDNPLALARQDAAAMARATQEIQAALVIGQKFPRDEIKAKARILAACQRKDLAELAEYEYSRGGTRITGPTIDLLRAIANRWGNIRFGWEEVERRQGESTVRCAAWDTQSNGQAFRSFVVRHWRDTQAGGYALDDERDIYEMLANTAARRVRACLEEVIDADVVNAAVDQCRKTLRDGEKTPIADRAVQMLNVFTEFGVTKAMIEKRLGNAMDAISENQIASLRRVFKSLKDGVGKREDYFKPETVAPQFHPGMTPEAVAKAAQPAPPKMPDETAEEAAAGLAPVQPAPAPAQAPAAITQTDEERMRAYVEANKKPELEPELLTHIKLLRGACKAGKIKEGTLLQYLADNGVTDGSVGSLEELALQNKAALSSVIKNWSSLSKGVLETMKAIGDK